MSCLSSPEPLLVSLKYPGLSGLLKSIQSSSCLVTLVKRHFASVPGGSRSQACCSQAASDSGGGTGEGWPLWQEPTRSCQSPQTELF